jgi:tetratricopeptide (TPR) repeat protein
MLRQSLAMALGAMLMAGTTMGAAQDPAPLEGKAHPRASEGYHPAPPTASLQARQASWLWMRVAKVDDGMAQVGDEELSSNEQGRYYKQAKAAEAVRLLKQSHSDRIKSVLWYSVAPALCIGVGGYAGYAVGFMKSWNEASSGNGNSNVGQNIGTGLVTGLAIGAAVGLGLGIPMGLSDAHESRVHMEEASQSFNSKLLQDLNLSVSMLKGGAALGVSKSFASSPLPDAKPAPAAQASDDLKLRFSLPPDHYSRAQALEAKGELSEAVGEYQEALKENDKDEKSLRGLGGVYYKQGALKSALHCFEQVLQLRPSDVALRHWVDNAKAALP